MMRTRLIMGAAVFALVLAACNSSGSKSSSTTTTAPNPSGSGVAGAQGVAPVVKTASNAQFGTILVDANGATLYTLTNNGKAVPCTSSACVAAWPPLLLPAGVTTATGTGVTGLGTASVPGGTIVTQAGLPLYRFSGDSGTGQANGDGISNFGGVWHVVKISGTGTGSGAATTPTTSGGGSGPGY
jgi:predicted lipoprotein with Yx(FWY)xxD motif